MRGFILMFASTKCMRIPFHYDYIVCNAQVWEKKNMLDGITALSNEKGYSSLRFKRGTTWQYIYRLPPLNEQLTAHSSFNRKPRTWVTRTGLCACHVWAMEYSALVKSRASGQETPNNATYMVLQTKNLALTRCVLPLAALRASLLRLCVK